MHSAMMMTMMILTLCLGRILLFFFRTLFIAPHTHDRSNHLLRSRDHHHVASANLRVLIKSRGKIHKFVNWNDLWESDKVGSISSARIENRQEHLIRARRFVISTNARSYNIYTTTAPTGTYVLWLSIGWICWALCAAVALKTIRSLSCYCNIFQCMLVCLYCVAAVFAERVIRRWSVRIWIRS